jgi:hypothetical protein
LQDVLSAVHKSLNIEDRQKEREREREGERKKMVGMEEGQ